MTSQLQRHFSNNITTLCRRLSIDVFFATLLQCRDMVERRRDLKTTTLQRRHDVACLLGNKWLDDSHDEAEDDLNEENEHEENEEILPSEQNASEDEIDFDCDDSGSSQNRPIYRKELKRKHLVHSIDSSLDESNFEPIVYINRNGDFETFTGYLGTRKNKNTKRISWDSEFPSGTGH